MNLKQYTIEVLKTAVSPPQETKLPLDDLIFAVARAKYSLRLLDYLKKDIFLSRPINYREAMKDYKGLLNTTRPLGEDKQLDKVAIGLPLKIVHSIVGIGTETGELLTELYEGFNWDTLVDPDYLHIKEEIGDLMFYIAMLCDALNLDLEEVLDKNIAKLRVRYGEEFSIEKANNRDLEAEREALRG